MGYSGLIYAAIVAAWAAFLVPRWVRRNEEIEQAAETDAARGVRVLRSRSTPVHAGHGRAGSTLVHGRADGMVVGAAERPDSAAPVHPSDDDGTAAGGRRGHDGDPVAAIDNTFAAAARRRRRLLTLLVVALIGSAGAALADVVPIMAPIAVVAVLMVFLLAARRAAVAQSRRRRAALRRAAGFAARSVAADDLDADVDDVELTADGKRVAVFEPPVLPEVDPGAWEPVAVPRPTYLDKATAPPARARSIDLNSSGAWTSGRLDPAGSIELPPQRRLPVAAPAPGATDDQQDDETYPDHRRAVGD